MKKQIIDAIMLIVVTVIGFIFLTHMPQVLRAAELKLNKTPNPVVEVVHTYDNDLQITIVYDGI